MRGPAGVLADPRVRAWDNLLRDPCGGQLAYPCYGGIDTGYLIRTVDYYQPIIVGSYTLGAPGRVNFVLQYTPLNLSANSGVNVSGQLSGVGLPSFSGIGLSDFITNSAAVKRYRPVAACLKFTPNGPYNSRAGVVAMAATPGVEFAATVTRSFSDIRAVCQHFAPNGSEAHEVRWLPTAADETFTDLTSANNTAAGTVLMVLDGVDATATSITQMTVNGYIEIVTAWEWVPEATGGLTISPKAPLPYTSQQVLSTISDLSKYVYEGVRAVSMQPGVMSGAVNTAATIITGGVRTIRTRASGMPMMQY